MNRFYPVVFLLYIQSSGTINSKINLCKISIEYILDKSVILIPFKKMTNFDLMYSSRRVSADVLVVRSINQDKILNM